jgi:NADPH:quinone reductase
VSCWREIAEARIEREKFSKILMQQIVDLVADGTYQARPARVFPSEQIADAHRLMESNSANGKIVVVR